MITIKLNYWSFLISTKLTLADYPLLILICYPVIQDLSTNDYKIQLIFIRVILSYKNKSKVKKRNYIKENLLKIRLVFWVLKIDFLNSHRSLTETNTDTKVKGLGAFWQIRISADMGSWWKLFTGFIYSSQYTIKVMFHNRSNFCNYRIFELLLI